MLARNLFGGGGAKAPPPGLAFRPAVTHGDPLSMRVFITEQPDIDLDSVSTRPAWQELEFALPLAGEKSKFLTYRPSKVSHQRCLILHMVCRFDGLRGAILRSTCFSCKVALCM